MTRLLRDMPSSFAPLEIASRIGRVRALFDRYRCDGLLVTKMENIAYLTGFSGSAGVLLITGDDAIFTSDGRYREQAEHQLRAAGVGAQIVIGGLAQQFAALVLGASSCVRLGLEENSVSWSLLNRIREEFPCTVVPTAGCVEELRIIKDAGEIDRIEHASAIADQALTTVKQRLLERPSESEFASELEYAMRLLGSTGASFETIVASGPNGALPHARPTARVVSAGDLVVIDFGAIVDGYHSDMSRTFVIGSPTAEQRRHYEAVRSAQQAGVDAVHPGLAANEVDRACRERLDLAGFGEFFTHGTGHGVGREVHEGPAVGAHVTDSLKQGMVVTVEPGVYLSGVGGVRIEDTLVVTTDGARPLTTSTKDYQL